MEKKFISHKQHGASKHIHSDGKRDELFHHCIWNNTKRRKKNKVEKNCRRHAACVNHLICISMRRYEIYQFSSCERAPQNTLFILLSWIYSGNAIGCCCMQKPTPPPPTIYNNIYMDLLLLLLLTSLLCLCVIQIISPWESLFNLCVKLIGSFRFEQLHRRSWALLAS